MICVSVREKRRCIIRIYIFLMVEMCYSFERCFTLFDLPLYFFTSVGVNRSADVTAVLPAAGLPQERQAYLFNPIQEFVREDKQDILCLRPGN